MTLRLPSPIAFFRRLGRDRRGNVLMIFGFAVLPLTFASGMAVDYGSAMRRQNALNAAADAAALSATSQPMMDQDKSVALARARQVFIGQVRTMTGVTLNLADTNQFSISVVDSSDGSTRTATVTFKAKSVNDFAKILGADTLPIQGKAVATAKIAPDIDFYVMLDVSSSMALPTTSAGIAFLRSKTVRTDYIWNPNGCAFACHQSNPDNPNVRDKNGNYMDYYALAQLNGIPLRIDAGKQGIKDMMDNASKESAANNAVYRFALYTFDRAVNFTKLTDLTTDYATAKTKADSAQTVAVQMHANLYDRQTEHAGSLAKMQQNMPTVAGTGNGKPGDTPQAVLFIITDGMRDEEINGRQMGPITQDQCTQIKAKGIRIAILYTTYQPESVNYDAWSIANILPILPTVKPALTTCASDGLFYEVSTDASISDGLDQLFKRTIDTSRLAQ